MIIFPLLISSRRKEKRGAMCFVRDDYVEFPAMRSAPVLSQFIGTESNEVKLSSIMKFENVQPPLLRN